MNKILKSEVEHMAQLARIHITGEEKKKYSKELSGVLDYVGKLNKADTKDVEETSQVTGLENVMRKDKEVLDWKVDKDKSKNRNKLLANAKERKGDYVKVKQILS